MSGGVGERQVDTRLHSHRLCQGLRRFPVRGLDHQGVDLKWREDLPAPLSLSHTETPGASGSVIWQGALGGELGGARGKGQDV